MARRKTDWKKLYARNAAYHAQMLKAWELHAKQQAIRPEHSATNTTQVAPAPKSGARKWKVKTKRCRVDEQALAKRWRVPVSYLRSLRASGEGPKVTIIEDEVQYKLLDLKAYERAQELKGKSVRDGLKRPRE